MKITHEQFIKLLAEEIGYDEKITKIHLLGLVSEIVRAVEAENSYTIEGFGTFLDKNGTLAFTPDERFASEINIEYEGLPPVDVDAARSVVDEDDEPSDAENRPKQSDTVIVDSDVENEEVDPFGLGAPAAKTSDESDDEEPVTGEVESEELAAKSGDDLGIDEELEKLFPTGDGEEDPFAELEDEEEPETEVDDAFADSFRDEEDSVEEDVLGEAVTADEDEDPFATTDDAVDDEEPATAEPGVPAAEALTGFEDDEVDDDVAMSSEAESEEESDIFADSAEEEEVADKANELEPTAETEAISEDDSTSLATTEDTSEKASSKPPAKPKAPSRKKPADKSKFKEDSLSDKSAKDITADDLFITIEDVDDVETGIKELDKASRGGVGDDPEEVFGIDPNAESPDLADDDAVDKKKASEGPSTDDVLLSGALGSSGKAETQDDRKEEIKKQLSKLSKDFKVGNIAGKKPRNIDTRTAELPPDPDKEVANEAEAQKPEEELVASNEPLTDSPDSTVDKVRESVEETVSDAEETDTAVSEETRDESSGGIKDLAATLDHEEASEEVLDEPDDVVVRKKSYAGTLIAVLAAIVILAAGAWWYLVHYPSTQVDPVVGELPVAGVSQAMTDDVGTTDPDDVAAAGVGATAPADRTAEPVAETPPPQEATVTEERPAPATSPQDFGLRGDLLPIEGLMYSVIIHSLPTEEAGINACNEIADRELRCVVVEAEGPQGRRTYRVGLGQFRTYADAQAATDRLPEPYRSRNFAARIN